MALRARKVSGAFEKRAPEFNKQVEHVSLSLHFEIYLLLFTGSLSLLFRYFFP